MTPQNTLKIKGNNNKKPSIILTVFHSYLYCPSDGRSKLIAVVEHSPASLSDVSSSHSQSMREVSNIVEFSI